MQSVSPDVEPYDGREPMEKVGKNTTALTHFRENGLELHFQDGAIGEYRENGTTNERVIEILIRRIESLDAILHSDWNDRAVGHLQEALGALQQRTADRQAREVEGTSAP